MTRHEFTFAFEGAAGAEGPWSHLDVVDFRGHEAMSSLYRYELTLFARAPAAEIDPHDLVRAAATLRIATRSQPEYRVVHGVVTEAEEIGPTHGGMLMRVVMMPPLARARFNKRCRIFLEKTTRQIIDAVLAGASLHEMKGGSIEPDDGAATFRPAQESYTWRITDASRIDDVAVRRYCVQYGESDFDFVARLLEEEGISFHFENGLERCLLVLADRDAGRAKLDPFAPLGHIEGRDLSSMKLGARLRPKAVSFADYNWKKPKLEMIARADASTPDAALSEYHYPGGYPDTPQQGKPLASALLDRYAVEASFAVAEGHARMLFAGSIFAYEATKPRYDGEYLVTKLEVVGHQEGVLEHHGDPHKDEPYTIAIECARRGKGSDVSESRFRPARTTTKPRIVGSQTGFVTADPSADSEIHVGGPDGAEVGCVRVRFHWDTDTERLSKEPSSCWIRVNHPFAGVGEGGVWHPRVGVEVIIEYEDGDPDRPLVTGRVYNGANRPPAPAIGADTISTFKSFSSPGGATFNEFLFDDAAGAEQIRLHAGKDWHSHVNHDRSERIANDSSSDVGVDRRETTGANRFAVVQANNSEMVNANHSLMVALNRTITTGLTLTQTIGIDKIESVGANRSIEIGANESRTIGADRIIKVGANHSRTIGANCSKDVGADETKTIGANKATTIGANHTLSIGANHSADIGANSDESVGANKTTTIAGIEFETRSSHNDLTTGESIEIVGASETIIVGAASTELVGGVDASIVAGMRLDVTAGVNVDVNAGLKVEVAACKVKTYGVKEEESGVHITMDGPCIEIEAVNVKTTSIMIVT